MFIQIFLNVNLSLNQILQKFLLYVRKTWMTSIISGNLSVGSYLPSIQKGSFTHMHGLTVYVCERRTSLYTGLISRKLLILNYVFDWLYFTLLYTSQFLTSFSSIYHLLCRYTVFDSFLSNIDKVLLIDQSANVLSHMVNFPTWIPGCGYRSPDILDLFFLMLVFVLQWLSLHWEILAMLLSQFQLTFHWIQNGMPRFIA